MNRPMELDIWKGDWGLASVDLESLRFLTLCKFAGAPITVNIKNHTLKTPKGKLPVFKHYQHTFITFDEVSNYLINKNYSPDHGLTQKQKADVVAFTMFLKDYLYPAILYVWWVDDRNRINITRKWFAKTLPFPLNFFYPDRYHTSALAAVKALFPHIKDETVLETEIYERANRCIMAISHRLGSQEFMFGAHPTSIDATLFAYLALLVKPPFPNGKLKNQVIGCSNLLKYVTRISQRYYAIENIAFEERKNETVNQPEVFPHKRRNQVMAATFAVIAMAFYALSTGILQVPLLMRKYFIRSPRTIVLPIRIE